MAVKKKMEGYIGTVLTTERAVLENMISEHKG